MPEPAAEYWLYRLFAADGELLYIGVTERGFSRFNDHLKTKAWWPEVDRHAIQKFTTRDDALLAERRAIASERSRYNRVHASARSRILYGCDPRPSPLTSRWDSEGDVPALITAVFRGPVADVITANYFPGKTKAEKEAACMEEMRKVLAQAVQVCPLGCGHVGARRLPWQPDDEDLHRFLDRVGTDLTEHLTTAHNATVRPQRLLTAGAHRPGHESEGT